jgi:hypothetical protein
VFNTRTRTADLNASGPAVITARARKAGSAAAAAAQNAAQNAAQGAAVVAQNAADSAAAVAQNAAQNAAAVAQTAAQNARQSADSAAQTTATQVKQGVFNARNWAAPRLEDAADYATATVAPAVASALQATAKKVLRRRRGRRTRR